MFPHRSLIGVRLAWNTQDVLTLYVSDVLSIWNGWWNMRIRSGGLNHSIYFHPRRLSIQLNTWKATFLLFIESMPRDFNQRNSYVLKLRWRNNSDFWLSAYHFHFLIIYQWVHFVWSFLPVTLKGDQINPRFWVVCGEIRLRSCSFRSLPFLFPAI